jgi:hypothetical protein
LPEPKDDAGAARAELALREKASVIGIGPLANGDAPLSGPIFFSVGLALARSANSGVRAPRDPVLLVVRDDRRLPFRCLDREAERRCVDCETLRAKAEISILR